MEEKEIIWNEVIDFFAKKYVAIKACLLGSTITLQGDILNVNLKSKTKYMLQQKNSDKLIEEYIKNSFGKMVKVNFVEPDAVEDSLSKEKEIVRAMMEKQKEVQAQKPVEKPKPAPAQASNQAPQFQPPPPSKVPAGEQPKFTPRKKAMELLKIQKN